MSKNSLDTASIATLLSGMNPEELIETLRRNSQMQSYIMMHACKLGFVDIVQYMLEQGGNVNQVFRNGETPLHVACRSGHVNVVDVLLSAGANVNQPNDRGETPLHAVCSQRTSHDVEIVKKLLAAGADMHLRTVDGLSPVYYASIKNYTDMVFALLSDSSSKGLDVQKAMDSSQKKYGRTMALGMLRQHQYKLYYASMRGQIDIVRKSLKEGADVDQIFEERYTPLYIASQNGHLEIVQTLLAAGANTNKSCYTWDTPLHVATEGNHEKIVDVLLAAGARVNALSFHHQTPLHIACNFDNADIVKRLLSAGANPNIKSQDGKTPFYIAAEHDNNTLIQMMSKSHYVPDVEHVFEYALKRRRYDIANRFDTIASFDDGTLTVRANVPSNRYQRRRDIERVIFMVGVTTIGRHAFDECVSLKHVQLPETLDVIEAYAFHACVALVMDIHFPPMLKMIKDYAFAECGIQSVSFPNSVQLIGDYAFVGCQALTAVILPNSLKKIRNHVFEACINLNSLRFPQSLEYIGDQAFYECERLTSLEFGDSLRNIGRRAFYRCAQVSSITFGNGLESIEYFAFCGCFRLTSLVFPDSLQTIEDKAFLDCMSLKSVTFGNGVLTIGNKAFGNCSALQVLDLPAQVTFEKDSFPMTALPPDRRPNVFDVAVSAYRLAKGSRLYSIIGFDTYEGRHINFFCRNVQLCSRAAQDDGYVHIFECRESLKLLSANSWRHKMFDKYVEYAQLEDILQEYCSVNGFDGWYLRCYMDNRTDDGSSCPLEKADYEVAILGTSFNKLNHLGMKPATREGLRDVKHLRRQKKKGENPEFKTWVDVRGKRKLK